MNANTCTPCSCRRWAGSRQKVTVAVMSVGLLTGVHERACRYGECIHETPESGHGIIALHWKKCFYSPQNPFNHNVDSISRDCREIGGTLDASVCYFEFKLDLLNTFTFAITYIFLCQKKKYNVLSRDCDIFMHNPASLQSQHYDARQSTLIHHDDAAVLEWIKWRDAWNVPRLENLSDTSNYSFDGKWEAIIESFM